MSIGHFNAFASPNYPPLAKIGLNITLNQPLAKSTEPLQWYDQFSDEVFLLKIYPELSARFLQRINLTGLKVIVIEAFGSGNFPLSGKNSLQPFLERCTDEGILLVITSQASYDSVNLSKYESGRAAAELGAIGAGDMTTEATLTKIMYLLSRQLSPKELKKQIQTNIAGELTE
jgi:L-asparaginase